MIKVGDVVSDGAGSRGVVVKVERSKEPDPFTHRIVESVYVDWGRRR